MYSFLLSAKINLVEWEKLKCNTDLCLDIKDENKLVYNSKKGIYGIKLKHLDCIPNIIGGELAEYQFSIDRTAKTFEANYKTEPIPPGVGILIEFDAPIYESCLDQIVFYEDAGWVLSHDFNPVYGCMDDNACNFSPRANNNDGSCNFALENYDCDGNCISDIDCSGECGGEKVVDKCNVCGGDNLSCADCAGTPNGDAVVDNCGTCDSDSNNDCIQDCAGTWGGTLIIDECNV